MNLALLTEDLDPRTLGWHDRLDRAAEATLVALLAFAPFAFGATEAWSEEIVVALAFMMTFCVGTKWLLRPGAPVGWTWAFAPMGFFILLAALQAIPLPRDWVAAVSHNTIGAKAKILGDLPDVDQLLARTTLSFYPYITLRQLRLLLVPCAVFFTVVNVHRRPSQIARLLYAVVAIGLVAALYALYQDFSGDRTIYGIATPSHPGSGPFINHSHFGQFMNLSIGAASGLLLMNLADLFPPGRNGKRAIAVEDALARLRDSSAWPVWVLAAMIPLGAAAILLSLTRGGVLSMLVAGAATAALVRWRLGVRGSGSIFALVGLVVAAALLYLGFDAVYDRLATLRHMASDNGERVQILKDLSVVWRRFWSVGTGLGTHEWVFPTFDHSGLIALAAHAENEYAQLLEEMGAPGAFACLAFIVVIALNYLGATRQARTGVRLAAFGIGYGLLAILIHSFSDFGQHLLANASLTATFAGLLVNLRRLPAEEAADDGEAARKSPSAATWNSMLAARLPRLGAVLAMTVAGGWALFGAEQARRAEAVWSQAAGYERELRENEWDGTDEQYASLIELAEEASALQPGNIEYRHWLSCYRWYAVAREMQADEGGVRMTKRSVEFISRIADELNGARVLCPTFGPTPSFAGQLQYSILRDRAAAARIRTGYALAPNHPTTSLNAGLLEVEEGNVDAAEAAFRKALALNPSCRGAVLNAYVTRAGRPDLAAPLVAGDWAGMNDFAKLLHATPGQEALAKQVESESRSLLLVQAADANASPTLLAAAAAQCVQQSDFTTAIDLYRRALAIDFGQVAWRLQLAHALARAGRSTEAEREARMCLQLRPELNAARVLLADLAKPVRLGALGQ